MALTDVSDEKKLKWLSSWLTCFLILLLADDRNTTSTLASHLMPFHLLKSFIIGYKIVQPGTTEKKFAAFLTLTSKVAVGLSICYREVQTPSQFE
jgi:hypothetical protein